MIIRKKSGKIKSQKKGSKTQLPTARNENNERKYNNKKITESKIN